MKPTITFGLVLAAILAMVHCASAAEAEESYYKGGLSFDLFGSVRTPDLQKNRAGVGLGATYYFGSNIGLGLEAIQENFGHDTLDEANALLYYRIPVERSAFYVFGGAGRNLLIGKYNAIFGAGIEHKLSAGVGLFGDARLVKTLDHEPAAMARIGLRFSF